MSDEWQAKIQNSIVKVIVKDRFGTGFFISSNLIFTARHVIKDFIENSNDSIKIEYQSTTLNCRHKVDSEELDIAVLELIDFPVDQSVDFPLLKIKKFNKGIYYESFGYLSFNDSKKDSASGKILSRSTETKIYGLNIDIDEDSYRGFSGAPLIIENNICGFLFKEFKSEYSGTQRLYARAFEQKEVLEFLKSQLKDSGLTFYPEIIRDQYNIFPLEFEMNLNDIDNFSIYIVEPFLEGNISPNEVLEKLVFRNNEKNRKLEKSNYILFPENYLEQKYFQDFLTNCFRFLNTYGTMDIGLIHIGLNVIGNFFNIENIKILLNDLEKIFENNKCKNIFELDNFAIKDWIRDVNISSQKKFILGAVIILDKESNLRVVLHINFAPGLQENTLDEANFIYLLKLYDGERTLNVLPLTFVDFKSMNSKKCKNPKNAFEKIKSYTESNDIDINILSVISNEISSHFRNTWSWKQNIFEKFESLARKEMLDHNSKIFILISNFSRLNRGDYYPGISSVVTSPTVAINHKIYIERYFNLKYKAYMFLTIEAQHRLNLQHSREFDWIDSDRINLEDSLFLNNIETKSILHFMDTKEKNSYNYLLFFTIDLNKNISSFDPFQILKIERWKLLRNPTNENPIIWRRDNDES